MLLGKSSIQETYYEILSVKENARLEEIRTSYRAAVLKSHPDKLNTPSKTPHADQESCDPFLKIQKAWEILSDAKLRSNYDIELQASRKDAVNGEDVSLKDMLIDDTGEVVELYYQCRCSDYYSVDSTELEGMGYTLSRDGSEISLRTPDALPASVVLPCGSCSLQVRLLINTDDKLQPNDCTTY